MNICLLGASGSIGKQTLDVMSKNPKDFTLVSFSVGHNSRVISNILKNNDKVSDVYLLDKRKVKYYQDRYPNVRFYSDDITKVITQSKCDMVVNALVGFVGLVPSITAIKNHKKLALANKESLVVGGELINKLLKEYKGELYPIDSEHSALWKCLKVNSSDVDKLILTASGGAFRNLSREELKDVKASDALKHPTWKMGNKITIDCATMVNKAFEVIEAGYLFNYPINRIDITLHDESYLHSYVSLKSGGFRGEISKPDMRNPIKFSLYQGNIPFKTTYFDSLESLSEFHFHKFDIIRYPVIKYAEAVLAKKGTMGTIFNRSNEVAVQAYLKDEIKFLDIERIIELSMLKMKYIKSPSLEEILKIDEETNKFATSLVKQIKKGESI